jgi:hypothetical protein
MPALLHGAHDLAHFSYTPRKRCPTALPHAQAHQHASTAPRPYGGVMARYLGSGDPATFRGWLGKPDFGGLFAAPIPARSQGRRLPHLR